MHDPDPLAMPPSSAGAAWLHRARSLARRVNLGWCFDQLVLMLPVTAAVATAAVLYLRTAGAAEVWVYLAAILPPIGACLIAWWRARKRFIGRRQALVRLESSLHLDSALSSAAQGIREWPEMVAGPEPLLRWRWERTFLPSLLSLLLVVLAVVWPIPASVLARNSPAPKPRNIQALETILEKLKDKPLIASEDLSTLRRQIDKLGEGSESLYSPSTLEAADHLAKRTSQGLSDLAQSSRAASRALQSALEPNGDAKQRAQQAEALEAAVRKMASASMKAPQALREALQDAAGNGMQELDPQAAAELQELLEQNQQRFQEMLEQLAPGQVPGTGAEAGGGDGAPGPAEQPGSGGAQHGDAPPAPLQFHQQERGVEEGRLEGLAPNPDASVPGDLLELRALRPPDPDAPLGVEAAGQIRREGGGGARLWQENLDPDEQRFLGEFYR